MAWIKEIKQSVATGELGKIYAEIEENRGKLSNIMRIHSLKPGTMKAHLDLYMAIMFRNSGISREVKEMIAVTVSRLNGCDYCVKHHAEALNHYWKDSEKLSEFVKRYDAVFLTDQLKAVFRYVEQLTINPDQIKEDDVRKLRQTGYNDEEILEINLIVSYFNFVNRIANGLGVEFTKEEMSGYRY